MKKSKILIIVFKGIGDVILTTPAIKAIKKHMPESEIYFLTKKFAADILKGNPYIKEVLIREEKPLMKLLSIRPDITLDYMLSSSSAAFGIFSMSKKRIGFFRPWGKLLWNQMVKTDFEGYTAIKRLSLLKPLGIDIDSVTDIKPEIHLLPEEKEKAEEKIFSVLDKKKKIATFDITSPREYRRLSAEKFIELADFVNNLGYQTVFHPGPGEQEYVENALRKSNIKHKLLKGLNLRELAHLISNSSLHIGASSAPMHIAVSFKVPTFTVYSPFTNPKAWDFPSQKHSGIQADLNKLNTQDLIKELVKFLKENSL